MSVNVCVKAKKRKMNERKKERNVDWFFPLSTSPVKYATENRSGIINGILKLCHFLYYFIRRPGKNNDRSGGFGNEVPGL
jgi:hypothetical protein